VICLSVYLSIYLCMYPICLSNLSISNLSVYLPAYLSIDLSNHMSIDWSIHPSILSPPPPPSQFSSGRPVAGFHLSQLPGYCVATCSISVLCNSVTLSIWVAGRKEFCKIYQGKFREPVVCVIQGDHSYGYRVSFVTSLYTQAIMSCPTDAGFMCKKATMLRPTMQ
jgi:hypothetical protein